MGGDASFNVELIYPLKDKQNYEFKTRIQMSDGSISLIGFDPAVTELNGIVNVSREEVSSESLFGRFLSEPVSIELSSSDPSPSGADWRLSRKWVNSSM